MSSSSSSAESSWSSMNVSIFPKMFIWLEMLYHYHAASYHILMCARSVHALLRCVNLIAKQVRIKRPTGRPAHTRGTLTLGAPKGREGRGFYTRASCVALFKSVPLELQTLQDTDLGMEMVWRCTIAVSHLEPFCLLLINTN